MIERHIHALGVELPPVAETAAEARERLRDKFPRNAVRRMTHLGLLVGAALDGMPVGPDDAVVYASTFAETRALEDFLLSFPTASPLLFQTSIHPSAVQQVLIGRQQPVARLWPLAGKPRLVEQALLTALLEPAPQVLLVGGEERGTWMLEHGMASERSFAFAARLTADEAGAIGRVTLALAESPEKGRARPLGAPSGSRELSVIPAGPAVPPCHGDHLSNEACPTLENFALALAGRRPLRWQGAGGAWSVTWR